MHSRVFSFFSALVAFVLIFTLTMPATAFADDGLPGDPTPEAGEEAPADGGAPADLEEDTPAEPAVEDPPLPEEAAPEEVTVDETVTDETVTEETPPDGATTQIEPSAEIVAEETPAAEPIAEVVEALVETGSVVVDENGEPLSMASEDVVEALVSADPWFDAGGGVIEGYSASGVCPLFVTNCYLSATPIQAAIDAAPTGATVHIENGVYSEQILITKSLTLLGNAGAVINSPTNLTSYNIGLSRIYPVIFVHDADNVTISGLTLDGTTYGSGNILRPVVGIAYYNASGEITNTVVQDFDESGLLSQTGIGIFVKDTDGVTISGNSIINNEIGVYTNDTQTIINNNNISGNDDYGVYKADDGTVNAENNFWGCTPVRKWWGWDWSGCDSVSFRVDRTPWLSSPVTVQLDTDSDTVFDIDDNCPLYANLDQADSDGDATGDICDPDDDNDGFDDVADNCQFVANDQADNDDDALGDICDADDDNDGFADVADNCQFVANDQADNDGDVLGDACDSDDDNDGVVDGTDGCPLAFNPGQEDTDGDGIQEACDAFPGDYDNDGVLDTTDNCPSVPNSGQQDLDNDGIGNACDAFPRDPDNDADGDGLGAQDDNCPSAYNPNQLDSDEDERGNACDGTPFGEIVSPTGGPIIPVTGGTTTFIDPEIDLGSALDTFANNIFPLEDPFQFTCILVSQTSLDAAITVGDQLIQSVGQCTYLANGVEQTFTLALDQAYLPGVILLVSFDGSEEPFASFAETGDPFAVSYFMVPLTIEETGELTA